jgi:hypothetical protein
MRLMPPSDSMKIKQDTIYERDWYDAQMEQVKIVSFLTCAQ